MRGVPEFMRSDNDPEFVARRVREFPESIDAGTPDSEPDSPWQSGYAEHFNTKFRNEC